MPDNRNLPPNVPPQDRYIPPQDRNAPPARPPRADVPRTNVPRANVPRADEPRAPRVSPPPRGVPYQPRRVEPSRRRPAAPPSYYPKNRSIGSLSPRRKRRPTPFLLIMIVFVIILLIVIFTSKGFKSLFGGSGSHDSGDTTINDGGTQTDNILPPPESDTKAAETTDVESAVTPPDDKFIIFIDPGHGFGDGGSSSDYLVGYTEKDITMLVAQEVVALLKSMGYEAMLTHDGVTMPKAPNDNGNNLFSALDERPAYVNANGVDLLVSIHCDSFEKESVSGTRVHYSSNNKYADASVDLVNTIIRSISESYQGSRSANSYPNDYNIIRYTEAPAALVEMGFVTNPDDAAFLLDPEWRTKMAVGIANGIAAFAATYEGE